MKTKVILTRKEKSISSKQKKTKVVKKVKKIPLGDQKDEPHEKLPSSAESTPVSTDKEVNAFILLCLNRRVCLLI